MKDSINRIVDLFRSKKRKQYLNVKNFMSVPSPYEQRPILKLSQNIIISRDNKIPEKHLINRACQEILTAARLHIFIDRSRDPETGDKIIYLSLDVVERRKK
jgi:hypothetical protein